MEPLKELSTMMRSKFKVIGKRTCEECGSSVNRLLVFRNDEEIEVSECLGCENLKVKNQVNEFYQKREVRKAKDIFTKFSMLSDDLQNATFDQYIPGDESQEDAKRKAIWFAHNFGTEKIGFKSMIFQGSYGLGKSHLSYCIAKDLEKKGLKVIFINSPALLSALKETYGKNAKTSESELLNMIKDVDLLVLDDLGAEYVKQDDGKESWAVDKLFQIISSRIGKHNVYTTNYSSADLTKKYGQHGGRIVSRLMQGTKIIKMSGEDHRMKGE